MKRSSPEKGATLPLMGGQSREKGGSSGMKCAQGPLVSRAGCSLVCFERLKPGGEGALRLVTNIRISVFRGGEGNAAWANSLTPALSPHFGGLRRKRERGNRAPLSFCIRRCASRLPLPLAAKSPEVGREGRGEGIG